MIEKMLKKGWKAKFEAGYDYVRYPRERKKIGVWTLEGN